MARSALLLGIDNYGDPSLNLTAPQRDVVAFADTLARVGYPRANIQICLSSQNYLSTSTLRRLIKSFLSKATAEDELLVYFSGHGVEQDGHRLLSLPLKQFLFSA